MSKKCVKHILTSDGTRETWSGKHVVVPQDDGSIRVFRKKSGALVAVYARGYWLSANVERVK